MRSIESVVSDYDGVVTDIQKGAEAYTTAFTEKLSNTLGVPVLDFMSRLRAAADEINRHPDIYGWKFSLSSGESIIVAPATDPYGYLRTQADIAISGLRTEGVHRTIPDEKDTQILLQKIFEGCRDLVTTSFREDAAKYLQELRHGSKFAIVSNSQKKIVETSIHTLIGDNDILVVGKARKYVVDPSWEAVPETTTLTGLRRPVYLRRAEYHKALQTVATINGPIDVGVGDSWELDLSLLEAMRVHTALLITDVTPVWEKNHYRDHPNGFSGLSLSEIASRILSV